MKLDTLETDFYYHIYNRGINSAVIFKSDDNKSYFLSLIGKHLDQKVEIVAFCLMDTHFHLVIKIVDDNNITQAFSNLFNSYAKAFNKQQKRTGSLFEKHFKRKRFKTEEYFKNSILYVHQNPIAIDSYKFSSYFYYIRGSNPASFKLDYSEITRVFDSIENLRVLQEKSSLTSADLQGFENLAGQQNNLQNRNKQQAQTNLQGLKDLVGLKPDIPMKTKFYTYIQDLQNRICSKLETIDGKAKFREDLWDRPEGGGGKTRVIENGDVFEKGGVNISGVHGALPKSMQTYFGVEDANFFACGLSVVLHPKNPMVPTVHANWRYFEMYDQDGNIVDQWFGGGQDLTPYYLFDEDAKHFHQICKTACDKHDESFYPHYKERCDTYFYNSHRNESRGIGGLFFDYCKKTEDMSMQDWYDFVSEVGDSFLDAYVPIVEKRKDLPYMKAQRDWQEIRRGRYVEFNLVHDKGTLFGLKTNGRIESILMSLPPHVQWVYDYHPEPGSEEEKLIEVLKTPIDWV